MIKKHLKKIQRTNQYNFNRSNYLRLDANERNLKFSNQIISKLKKYLNNNLIQSYPSHPENLIKKIARKEKVNSKFINIVPGADSAIKYIFEIFSGKKKEIACIYPTYGMIDVYSKIYEYKILKVKEEDFNHIFSLKKKLKNISFFYLANPNQPSGKVVSIKKILELLKFLKREKKYLILDEAYIDFSNQNSLVNFAKKFKNLILIKTFSKSIGIAGLRFGYYICHPEVSKVINSVRPIFDISSFTMKVAEFFIDQKKLWKQYINEIKESKQYVNKECKRRNFNYLNTEANFFYIFFKKKNIKKIVKNLNRDKILVKTKYVTTFNLPKNSIRITYGSREQMKYLFNKLDKIKNL